MEEAESTGKRRWGGGEMNKEERKKNCSCGAKKKGNIISINLP